MELSSALGCVQCLPPWSPISIRTCAHYRQWIIALAGLSRERLKRWGRSLSACTTRCMHLILLPAPMHTTTFPISSGFSTKGILGLPRKQDCRWGGKGGALPPQLPTPRFGGWLGLELLEPDQNQWPCLGEKWGQKVWGGSFPHPDTWAKGSGYSKTDSSGYKGECFLQSLCTA